MTAVSLMALTGCTTPGGQTGPINSGNARSGSEAETTAENGSEAETVAEGTDQSGSEGGNAAENGSSDQNGSEAGNAEENGSADQGGSEAGNAAENGSSDQNGSEAIDLSFAGQPDVSYSWLYSGTTYLSKYSDDYSTTLISSSYELLHLCDEAAAAYPKLADTLESVNAYIEDGQKQLYRSDENYISGLTQKEIDDAREQGYVLAGYELKTYVRRADGDVLSFMCCTEKKNSIEWVYHSYMGFSIDMHTGKLLGLEDIVNDEQALISLLTSKAAEAANEYNSGFNGYQEEYDLDKLEGIIRQSLEGGGVSWTLDPQGLTFYFDTYNLIVSYLEVPILFAEDPEGKIFNGDYPEPAYWTTYVQPFMDLDFDADNDGDTDELYILGYESHDEDFGYEYNLTLDYNGQKLDSAQDMVSDDRFILVHEPGRTWLYMTYSSYNTPITDIYELSDDGLALLQTLTSDFAMPEVDYSDVEVVSYSSRFTDPTNIYMNVRTDCLSTCRSIIKYNLERDGSLSIMEGVYEFLPNYQWTLTAKIDLYHVETVLEDGSSSGYVCDIHKGSELKMLRTDNRTYCDLVDSDGNIVRIYVQKDSDYLFMVYTGDEKYMNVYEVFDGLMFGQ